MRSSIFKLSTLLLITAWALLAIPFYAYGNTDAIVNDKTDSGVIIDGSDAQIICGDAVNLGSATKADKLQNNNGAIRIVKDTNTDKKESANLKAD